MAVSMGSDYIAALTERGGLCMFCDSQGDEGADYSAPVLLGGVGYAAGDELHNVAGGTYASDLVLGLDPGGQMPDLTQARTKPHTFNNERIVMVSAGDTHTCCVTDSGVVWAWGSNASGELGLGDTKRQHAPVAWHTDTCAGSPAVMVACGDMHTLVLTRDKRVWSCGKGLYGQNGQPHTKAVLTPARVAGLDSIVMVAAAQKHCMAVGEDGRVWTWGLGGRNLLGFDAPQNTQYHTPTCLGVDAFGGSAVELVAAGCFHSAAVTVEGELWVWGEGTCGILGLGDSRPRLTPTLVQGGLRADWDGARVRLVACSDQHSIVLTSDGAVWTFGDGIGSTMGHHHVENVMVPTRIAQTAFGGADIVTVAAYGNASAAVTADGLLYCWGAGNLGNGPAYAYALQPTPVAASLAPGLRVGRGCAMPRAAAVAVCMGMLATAPAKGATTRARAHAAHKSTDSIIALLPDEVVQVVAMKYAELSGHTSSWARGSCACWPCARA